MNFFETRNFYICVDWKTTLKLILLSIYYFSHWTWRNVNEFKYIILSKVVQNIFIVLVFTVASGSTFSTTRERILDCFRS